MLFRFAGNIHGQANGNSLLVENGDGFLKHREGFFKHRDIILKRLRRYLLSQYGDIGMLDLLCQFRTMFPDFLSPHILPIEAMAHQAQSVMSM